MNNKQPSKLGNNTVNQITIGVLFLVINHIVTCVDTANTQMMIILVLLCLVLVGLWPWYSCWPAAVAVAHILVTQQHCSNCCCLLLGLMAHWCWFTATKVGTIWPDLPLMSKTLLSVQKVSTSKKYLATSRLNLSCIKSMCCCVSFPVKYLLLKRACNSYWKPLMWNIYQQMVEFDTCCSPG